MLTETWLTILGMAAVTYAIRASGYLFAGLLPEHGRVAAFFKALPGTVLIALIAPGVFAQGLSEAVAGCAALLAAILTRNLFIVLCVGVVVAFAARRILLIQ
jgi:uncharacterized membrane protein